MHRTLLLAVSLGLVMAFIAGGSLLVIHEPAQAVVIVLGIYLAVVTFLFPRVGLMILVLMMLFSPQVAVGQAEAGGPRGVTLRGDDAIILLVALGWLARAARRRGTSLLRWTPLHAPIIIMSVIIVVSALVNIMVGNVRPMQAVFYGTKRLEYFLVFLMVTSVFWSWREVSWLFWVFLGGCLVISVVALYQYLFARRFVVGGVTGTFGFGQANTLGGFCVLVLCVWLGLSTTAENVRRRYFFMLMCGLTLLCLLLTYSRGAYVAAPFAVLTVLVFDRYRRAYRNLFILGVPVLALMVSVFLVGLILDLKPVQDVVTTIGDQVRSITNVAAHGVGADASLNSRWVAWGKALEFFAANPVLGMGVGSKTMGWYDAHWFRELAETGLAGLLTFLWLQIAAFQVALRVSREAGDALGGLALGFLGGQVGLWIHGFTAENFYIIRTTQPFFFLLGVLVVGYMDRAGWAPGPEATVEPLHAAACSELD